MDFLITGATGFIGKKLVNHLLARGDSVNYLGRERSQSLDSRAAFHSWDGSSAAPRNTVPRLDAVVHLMGEPIAQRWNPQVKERIRQSRVQSTRQLVAAISTLKYKPSVLVSASAIGYYGNRGDEILTEASMPGIGFLADVCINWEYEAMRARAAGLRVAMVRITLFWVATAVRCRKCYLLFVGAWAGHLATVSSGCLGFTLTTLCVFSFSPLIRSSTDR